MSTDSIGEGVRITRWHCYLLLTATTLTYLLITLGGIVCITGSARGCPDWPGCYGQIFPPPRVDAIIEYLHRFVAALTSPFIIAAAIVSWWKARPIRWVSRPPVIAIPFLLAVIVFGALAVLQGLAPGAAAVDLGSALIVLALMVTATTAAFARRADPGLPDRLVARDARPSLWALGAVFIVLVSGVLVAGRGSLTRCLGWPMWRLAGNDLPGWPQAARLLMAGVASVLIVVVVIHVRSRERKHLPLLRTAAAVGVLFLAEMTAGVLMLVGGFTILLLAIYVAVAAALWGLLVALAVLSGIGSR